MAFRTSANIDKNHNKGLIASNASDNGVLVLTGAALTNSQPMHVAVVDSTGAHITALSNTQYTEADTDTTITGTAIMWEDAADTLRAVSATKPLPVDIVDATGVTITVDSEFPAAAAITDNFANPTTTSIMSMGMLYDGSTWDRALGNSTDGALVNLGTNNDVTVTSGGITETNSAAIKTAVEILDNAISGNEMQVDVLTMPAVTVDSEFPAAAALTDDFANPTTTNVAGMNMLWDGATWDRALGNSTDGALVNLGTNNDVTVTGSVTANAGTNLNTSALLTSSDFAYASSLSVCVSRAALKPPFFPSPRFKPALLSASLPAAVVRKSILPSAVPFVRVSSRRAINPPRPFFEARSWIVPLSRRFCAKRPMVERPASAVAPSAPPATIPNPFCAQQATWPPISSLNFFVVLRAKRIKPTRTPVLIETSTMMSRMPFVATGVPFTGGVLSGATAGAFPAE